MILLVLKIIGIIFLVIIGLLICIIGMVLWAPIRYQFEGEYQDRLEGAVRIKWMPVFLNISASFKDKQFEYVIKLFGGVVMTNRKDCKVSWIGRRFFSDEKSIKEEMIQEEPLTQDKTKVSEKEKTGSDADFREQKQSQQVESEKTKRQKKETEHRKSISDKLHEKVESIKQKKNTLRRKIKKLLKKKDALQKIYYSERFHIVKEDVKLYIKELFMIIRPDNLEGYVHFGLEDPAVTGQILGILAMVLPLYQNFLEVHPNFTTKAFDGNIKGDGRIFLFFLVKLAIKILLNKNLIKVTKKVQTILEA